MIIAAFVVASVATASAECTWVLWRHDIVLPEMWPLQGGYPTVRECRDDLAGLASSMKEGGYRIPGDWPLWQTAPSVTFERERDNRGYLLCLPDTVDPPWREGRRAVTTAPRDWTADDESPR